jgi:TolB-like protein/DNA-binding winged helix-turn-helix (wHTH) protein/Flp pilus assembly protein TadD
VDPAADEIRREDRCVKLEPRTMALLLYLAARPNQVVSTEELLAHVWKGVIVTTSSLYQSIALLRHALGDESGQPRYIENVPRKGYRLIARIERRSAAAGPAIDPGSERKERRFGDRRVVENASPRARWWRVAVAAVVVAVGLAFLLTPESIRQRLFGQEPSERSVAVLPFQNVGADAAEAYLADGLTEDLMQSLGRLPGVDVTARSSVFVFRQRKEDVREIARRLGVRYIVDGSVRRVEGHLRINAQLVDAESGFEMWSESYDRPFADVLRVQEDIARSVARSLEVLLTSAASRSLARRARTDPAAFDAYLRGRAFWNERSVESLRRAEDQFRLALARDPQHAQAHVALAELYAVLPLYGVESPETAFPRARTEATRALELDPELAEARATLAVVRYQYEWNWRSAEEEFRRALALNPSYATARQWYAEFLSYSGRYEEARRQIETASSLDPLSPVIGTLLGSPALWSRRYQEAQRLYRAAIATYPDFALAYYSLGLSQIDMGQAADAVDSFERSRAGLGVDFVAPSLAHAYVALGRTDEARTLLADLLQAERAHYVSPYKIAVTCVALGDREQAFVRLTRAADIHDDRLALLGVDPLLDGLRTDPRFAALLQRVASPAVAAKR